MAEGAMLAASIATISSFIYSYIKYKKMLDEGVIRLEANNDKRDSNKGKSI